MSNRPAFCECPSWGNSSQSQALQVWQEVPPASARAAERCARKMARVPHPTQMDPKRTLHSFFPARLLLTGHSKASEPLMGHPPTSCSLRAELGLPGLPPHSPVLQNLALWLRIPATNEVFTQEPLCKGEVLLEEKGALCHQAQSIR